MKRFELNRQYFLDSVAYCKAEEQKLATPSLFDLIEAEDEVPMLSAAGD